MARGTVRRRKTPRHVLRTLAELGWPPYPLSTPERKGDTRACAASPRCAGNACVPPGGVRSTRAGQALPGRRGRRLGPPKPRRARYTFAVGLPWPQKPRGHRDLEWRWGQGWPAPRSLAPRRRRCRRRRDSCCCCHRHRCSAPASVHGGGRLLAPPALAASRWPVGHDG